MLRSEHRQNLWEATGHAGALLSSCGYGSMLPSRGWGSSRGRFLSAERSVVSSRALRALEEPAKACEQVPGRQAKAP